MDILTILGIVGAIGAILLGQFLEGGHAGSLVQLTAFIIVIGGTMGACMVAFPKSEFMRGMKMVGSTFKAKHSDMGELSVKLVELATLARREGVLSLEGKIAELSDPFLKRGLQLVVDGVDPGVTRETLEVAIFMEFEENNAGAKVWESAGGFAPTVGILGAVLGLIHVMENLDDPTKLGPGIAVAFVATVYGVGSANLFFLPLATKMKRNGAMEKERKTLIAEGLLSIQEGLSPRIIEEKLKSFAGSHGAHGEDKK